MVNNQEIMLESKICDYFINDNGVTCHFRYEYEGDKVILSLYTFNKRTNVNFLFHKLEGSSIITALSKMSIYISEQMIVENNYTVYWNIKGNEEIFESYFRASDIEEVMVKFYDGKKNKEVIDVTNIKLSPIS